MTNEKERMERLDEKVVFDIVQEIIYCNCNMQMRIDMKKASRSITKAICKHFGQPQAVVIKWPLKEIKNIISSRYAITGGGYYSALEMDLNKIIDVCQQAVKEAGLRKVRYPSKRIVTDSEDVLEEQRIFGRNAAIDEMKKLNEKKG